MESMKGLLDAYGKKKEEIRKRLEEFREWGKDRERIISELFFCLCTPQSSARRCDAAVRTIRERGLLFGGSEDSVRACLSGVRFPGNKAGYIVEARERFGEILEAIGKEPAEAREWLVRNVKGLGYKEASHFLRNTGRGRDLAILDRHILKNLARFGVIPEVPKNLTRKRYLEIEERMREFSERVGIAMEELDLLFWSMETGEVFK